MAKAHEMKASFFSIKIDLLASCFLSFCLFSSLLAAQPSLASVKRDT